MDKKRIEEMKKLAGLVEFDDNSANKRAMYKLDQAMRLCDEALEFINQGHRSHLSGPLEKAVKEISKVYAELN